MHTRYQRARAVQKSDLLNEVCHVCGYHRKHAIRKFNQSLPDEPRPHRTSRRGTPYDAKVIGVLKAVWEVAGYPWSVRLKAVLLPWLPWIRMRFRLTRHQEQQLLVISARQIDRRLQSHKTKCKKRRYGRTKPGALLKHRIPIRTEYWEVTGPGYVEIDLAKLRLKPIRGI